MTETGKWLAASVPFAAAVFGFLGVTDGEVTRILVNFRGQFVAALILILLAAAVGAWVPALGSSQGLRLRLVLLIVGFAMLVGGLVWMAHLAADSASANERPRISADLTDTETERDRLTADISAAGLTVDEHLIVTVTGQPAGRRSAETLLYGARIGPDPTGIATHALAIPVRTGQYGGVDVRAQLALRPDKTLEVLADPAGEEGCNEESRELGCVTVFTPGG
jgi:hypothetical protein